MLDLSGITLVMTPFPYGMGKNVFDLTVYKELVSSFPPVTICERLPPMGGLKYNLRKDDGAFDTFVNHCLPWSRFRDYVVEQFPSDIDALLTRNNLRLLNDQYTYSSRFEFSFLPADTGHLIPHTDTGYKVIAMVLPMVRPGEWDSSWGGHTDMLVPKQGSDFRGSAGDNYQHSYDEFDIAATCPFLSNSANILLKTDNSWHGVRCKGPQGVVRKSVTLNLVKWPKT